MEQCKTSKKAVALTVAIAMLLIAVVLQASFTVLFYNNYRLSEKYLNEVKAFYSAYGGYVLAMEEIRSSSPQSANLIGATYKYSLLNVYPQNGKTIQSYEIVSYAEAEQTGKAKIRAWVEKVTPDNKIRLIFWREVEPVKE